MPPVSLRMARNFYVTDTYLETPPSGVASGVYDSTDRADFLGPFSGLNAVPDDIRALLPPECRSALDKAVQNEKDWQSRWGTESEKASRRQPTIDKAIVPYSMN